MREDLEAKYKDALNSKDNEALWHCIENACRAELVYYLKKEDKNNKLSIPKEVYEGIILDSVIMVYKRITQGYSYNYKIPRNNIPIRLGSYCYTVVVNEFKRSIKNFLTEREIINNIQPVNGYNWLIGDTTDE